MAPRSINLQQGSEAWKQWRSNHVGASEVAIVMGISPYQTPLQLYEQKISGRGTEENEAMRIGKEKEPLARNALEKLIGYAYPQDCVENDNFPFLVASLDGYNPNAPVKAIELKAPGPKNHQSVKMGVIPAIWFPQCQAIMAVLETNEIYFSSYASDDDFEVIKIARDDKFIEKMLEACKDFRQRLISFLPPDPTDKDLEDLSENKEAFDIGLSLAEIQTRRKFDEEKEKALRERLKQISNGRSCKVGDFRFVRFMRKGAIQYDKIPELQGVELEQYRKDPIEQWRFS